MLFVLVARASGSAPATASSRQRVFALGVPVVIALNKVDRPEARATSRTQMHGGRKLGDFHALHPVSAKTGDGIG